MIFVQRIETENRHHRKQLCLKNLSLKDLYPLRIGQYYCIYCYYFQISFVSDNDIWIGRLGRRDRDNIIRQRWTNIKKVATEYVHRSRTVSDSSLSTDSGNVVQTLSTCVCVRAVIVCAVSCQWPCDPGSNNLHCSHHIHMPNIHLAIASRPCLIKALVTLIL